MPFTPSGPKALSLRSNTVSLAPASIRASPSEFYDKKADREQTKVTKGRTVYQNNNNAHVHAGYFFPKSWILCRIATKLRLEAYTCFEVDDNVKEKVSYQGRWDLRAKTASKHVAPVTALREENKDAQCQPRDKKQKQIIRYYNDI